MLSKPVVAAAPFGVDQTISTYIGAFFAAFFCCLIVSPMMITIGRRYGIVDYPDGVRKLHREPTARLGGVTLLLGWLAGVGYAGLVQPHTAGLDGAAAWVNVPTGLIVGASIVVFVGMIDDRYTIRARYKLIGQVAAALALAWQGIGMDIVSGGLTSLGSVSGITLTTYIPGPALTALNLGLVIFFVVGACNAVNFLDGADGLAGGVVTIITAGLCFIAVYLATGAYSGGVYSVTGDPIRLVLCLVLAGALLGFLPYNFRPASLFMGDAGSMLLGYLAIALVLLLGERGDVQLVMAGLAAFALPIIDTALAIVRRTIQGRPIAAPDNFHLHHLLLRTGFSTWQTVLLMYAMTLGFAALGGTMILFRRWYVAAVFCVLVAFVTLNAYKIGQRFYQAEHATDPEPELADGQTAPVPDGLASEPIRPLTAWTMEESGQSREAIEIKDAS